MSCSSYITALLYLLVALLIASCAATPPVDQGAIYYEQGLYDQAAIEWRPLADEGNYAIYVLNDTSATVYEGTMTGAIKYRTYNVQTGAWAAAVSTTAGQLSITKPASVAAGQDWAVYVWDVEDGA
jgi:hypothetical protein